MPKQACYEFTDEVTSDLSFVARGATLEALFSAAAEALLAATVSDPAAVVTRERVPVALEEDDLELLLLGFLSELVYRRDAERLLLRAGELRIAQREGRAKLVGTLVGERFDPARHALETEVKAVTAHGLQVRRTDHGYEAHVTVDV